jgi:Hypothetical protein (DUF2513)
MKREMDLVRQILKKVEDEAAAQGLLSELAIENHDHATVCAHVELLIEAGLLKGKLLITQERAVGFVISRLTWDGHDFIDLAREDTLWAKAESSVLKNGSSFTFGLLLEWLKAEVRNRIGL